MPLARALARADQLDCFGGFGRHTHLTSASLQRFSCLSAAERAPSTHLFVKLATIKAILLVLTVLGASKRHNAAHVVPSSASGSSSSGGRVMLHDICTQNPYGSKRFFLSEGENGTIVAQNLDYERISVLTARAFSASFYGQPPPATGSNNYRVCSVELTTCPTCSIRMNFKVLNLLQCDAGSSSVNTTGRCSGCDYLTVKENYYSTPFVICGRSSKYPALHTNHQYHSVGRSVTFSFVFSRSYDYAFLLEYASVVNTRLISGRSGEQGVISSPHFPTVYPQDYSNEVILRNTDLANTSSGSVLIVFDDYALGISSFLDIYDGNGQRQHTLGTSFFRPPVVLLPGNEVSIRFYANGGRASGYRATYKFLNESADQIEVPLTDCGGLVDDYGGVITMNNMSDPGSAKLYDCIWLVKPLGDYYMSHKTHLLVRVAQLTNLESGTTLDIRQGLTSQSPLVDTLVSDVAGSPTTLTSEYLVPSDIGFYIRLRGRLTNDFKMAIAYAAFTYTECYTTKDFVCLNHRCISSELRCDGFNHCGDNSDEQSGCGNTGVSPQDPSWWMTHTPKYYFPKIAEYGDFGTTSLVLFAATLGIFGVVIFIACVLALLYRMSAHSQLMRERQARLDFVRSQLVTPPDEPETEPENPPSYEAPPDYTEIAKLAELAAKRENAANSETSNTMRPPQSTPQGSTPGHRRRRELARQVRSHAPGSGTASPASSRSSTPARSRNSTPGRSRHSTPQRRNRRALASQPIHIHSTHLRVDELQADANIPTSPPPPYDFQPDFNIRISRTADSGQDQTVMSVNDMQVTSSSCDCPGACSCRHATINLTIELDPSHLRPNSYRVSGSGMMSDEAAEPDSLTSVNEPTSISSIDNPPRSQRISRSFQSVDQLLHPSLDMLRRLPWNKSM